jgi:uroporphyrin-III C-methyltransferase
MGFVRVQLEVDHRKCLLVGGGAVALRKSHELVSSGASVRVVAREILPSGWPPGVELCPREFCEADAKSVSLVVIATDDSSKNEWIAEVSRKHGALIAKAEHECGSAAAPPLPLESNGAGRVFLVGAGPGDPGLLTVKGVACLRIADTVFFDALVSPELLEMYCPQARRIGVRKRKGHWECTQAEINDLLVAHARRGEIVVRLKGGDPILFGRGSEEVRALHEAGIPFEVVSGVSSISAAPAYAGIAVTDRELASSVGIYSAHRRSGVEITDTEWHRMAEGPDTLLILMGKTRIALVTSKLVEHGRPPSTAAAMVFDGTLPSQFTVVGTLADLAARVSECCDIDSAAPALIVIGSAVQTRSWMGWFAERSPSAAREGSRS